MNQGRWITDHRPRDPPIMIDVQLSPWTETLGIHREGKNVRSLYVASVGNNTRENVWQTQDHASSAFVKVTGQILQWKGYREPKGTT